MQNGYSLLSGAESRVTLRNLQNYLNPIRPRVFDALGSIGRVADSAPLIYFCSGQPRVMKLCMCIEQRMVSPKMKSTFRYVT